MADISGVSSTYNGADLEFHDKATNNLVFAFRTKVGSNTVGSAANGLAAAGNSQGTATPVTANFSQFTTVAAGNPGCVLPTSANFVGGDILIFNAHATNAMVVYPALGDQINALGVNASFSLTAGKNVLFCCVVAGQWHAILSS